MLVYTSGWNFGSIRVRNYRLPRVPLEAIKQFSISKPLVTNLPGLRRQFGRRRLRLQRHGEPVSGINLVGVRVKAADSVSLDAGDKALGVRDWQTPISLS